MAKKEVKYVCEVCGLKYELEKDADACADGHFKYGCNVCGQRFMKKEDSDECRIKHFKPVLIKNADFNPIDRKNKYPESIKVSLKNEKGQTVILDYYRSNKYK